MIRDNKCGVCNEDIPIDWAQLIRKESDGSFTCYHMWHEGQLKDLEPCPDCGYHRKLCDECKEGE